MYGLRKVNKDLKHYGFTWDLSIGAVNTAADWTPERRCGGGLHMLPNAQGDYYLLDGYYWVVVEFDETQMVMIDESKAKVESCTVVHVSGTNEGLLEFFNDVKFDSQSAYGWAKDIGDNEYMRQFIAESHWAYYWALNIGDREYMMQFIDDAHWAYYWAKDIGDNEYMRHFIAESHLAYYWAKNIGDREYMMQFIDDSESAYYWAKVIGDNEYMMQFVTEPYWAYRWAVDIGDREYMRQFVTEPKLFLAFDISKD